MKVLKRNHFFIPSRFEDRIEKFFHNNYLRKKEKVFCSNNFSIISNSCIGASIYKDYNIRFTSPFIAVYIRPEDFVVMLSDLKEWVNKKIVQIDYRANFPVGLLGGKIKVFFVHETSFEDAVKKWRYRAERINWNNLFVILDPIEQTFLENDFKTVCSIDTIKDFLSLKYKNQICFVSNKDYVVDARCVFLKCYAKYEYPPYIGRIILPSGKRVYDKYFDIFSWINGNLNDE